MRTRLLCRLWVLSFALILFVGCVSSSSLESYAAAMDKRLATIEDEVDTNSSAAGTQFSALGAKINSLRDERVQIDGSLTSLRQEIALLRESDRDLKADVQERLEKAEQEVKALRDRVADVRIKLIKMAEDRCRR